MVSSVKKQPRFFATFEDMTAAQLAYSAGLSLEDRLRELNRLNRIAFAAWQTEPPRLRQKRMQLHFQGADETLEAFFSRTAIARQAWISSLTNSGTLSACSTSTK